MSTVTVACKVENGLILRLFRFEDVDYPVLGGGFKTVKEARQIPETGMVTINGPRRLRPSNDGFAADGFVLTHGVDEEFMTEWMRQNADHPAVMNGLIKVHGKATELKAMTAEVRDVKTGLEPLDPKGDYRVPKKVRSVTPFNRDAA